MFIGEGKAPQARSGSALCAIRALPLATAAVFRNWRLVVIPGISIMQEPRRYLRIERLSSVELDSGECRLYGKGAPDHVRRLGE
jgi:hypothetical protein